MRMNKKDTYGDKKKALRRKKFLTFAGWLLPLILVALLLFEVISIWVVILLFIFWLMDLLPTDYYLTKKYIQNHHSKILHSEIQDVRLLFYWYIITDEHGDSIWIPYRFLEEDDQADLMNWLGIEEKSIGEQTGRSDA